MHSHPFEPPHCAKHCHMRTNIRGLMLTDWCRRSDSKQDKETKSMKMRDLVYLAYTLRQARRGRPTSMCTVNKRQWPAASTAGVQRSPAGVGEVASPGRLSGAGTAGFADPERNQLQTRAQGLSSSGGPIPGGREQGKSGARTRSTQHPPPSRTLSRLLARAPQHPRPRLCRRLGRGD